MLFQRSGLQLRIYGTERFHNFAYERFAYLTSRKKIGGTDDKQLYHHMYSRVSSFKPTPFVSDRSSSSPAVGPLMHQGAAPVDLSLKLKKDPTTFSFFLSYEEKTSYFRHTCKENCLTSMGALVLGYNFITPHKITLLVSMAL